MKNGIFRKESLEKVKSPDSLDDYIKVSNPGIWILLVSVIFLLVGSCVWGIFGHIESTIPTSVYVENGKVVCYVSDDNIFSAKVGLTVKFDEQQAKISSIGKKGEMGYVCTLDADSVLPDGFYEGKIITKSYKPISFIIN